MPAAFASPLTTPRGSRKRRTKGRGEAEAAEPAQLWKIDWQPSLVSKLSDGQLAHCKAVFFDIDRDGSGSIDEDELMHGLRSLGHAIQKQDVKQMIASIEECPSGNGDGRVDLREFLHWYARLRSEQPDSAQKRLRETFDLLGGANGKLSKEALQRKLEEHFGICLDVDELLDRRHTGDLDLEEFGMLLQTPV